MKFINHLLLILFLSIGIARAQDSLAVNKLGQVTYSDVLNDVWGYASPSGSEYALVGVNSGLSIVDVTNPVNPVKKHFIPGANSIWRDIKTWSHYAYIVHDSYAGNSDGIMIVDMNTVDSVNPTIYYKYPVVTVDDTDYTFNRAHNIYIDENGVLYVFGSNAGVGGVLMFDITGIHRTDPLFLGAYNGAYVHDGVARGDTLWAAAILAGQFKVINVSNKANPTVMASQTTPGAWCHNIWFSDDNQTVFTTDEKTGAYVTAYDVSNLSNITELDRIRTIIDTASQVIPHNVHVKGNFLVTSYYTSGLQIVDASIPNILVETAYYDTSPLSGDGFNGAWGAYPFLPSGNILVSDRQEGLFILHSTYPHASYLSLFVKDSLSGFPLVNAQVNLLNTAIHGKSDLFGSFRDGQSDTGVYQLVVAKPGYKTDTLSIDLQRNVLLNKTVALLPYNFSVSENRLAKKGVVVYPNPSSGKFTILLNDKGIRTIAVEIIDIQGRKMAELNGKLENGKFRIDQPLPKGLYLLKITDSQHSYLPVQINVAF